mgnify:CR=1 FL=1
MKVLKFGGSSLADAKRYLKVYEISANAHKGDDCLFWCIGRIF